MTNYLPQRKKKKISVFAAVLLLISVVVVIVNPPVPRFITQAVYTIAVPVSRAQNSASLWLSDFSFLLQTKKALMEENQALKRRLDRAQIDTFTAALLKEENRLLKESFGRGEGGKGILAAVVTRPNISPYDTFVIDAGEAEGVRVGDRALVSGAVSIGEVTNVFRSTSVITLFSSPNETVDVLIGQLHIAARAEGQGGGNFKVTLPRGIDVAEGDIITMPGINQDVFGVVEYVHADPTDPFQTILFKNPVNLNEIYFVEITPVRRD